MNRSNLHKRLKPYYIFGVLLLLWFVAAKLEVWNAYLLPPPWKVADAFVTMWQRGEITASVLVSLRRVLIGLGISFALAFLASLLTAYQPNQAEYLRQIINFMRNVPPLAVISLLILWFGIGETPKIIVIVLASFFPIYMNISKGFLECDRKLIEVGRSMGFSEKKVFWKICLPYAREDILVGLRTGLGYSWRALIGAEMIAASSGLGYMIVYAQQMSRSDKVLIGIFLIGIIGCISDMLFSLLIRKVCVGGVKND